ncbi:MAG TPA: hypothetical protein VFK37_05220 [Bacillales bacterium]|nr:hypothetical protein [Bacillales bacterium]
MNTISVSKKMLNPILLPGMGRSIEIAKLSGRENLEIRKDFAEKKLQVEFSEEPGIYYPVINVWTDPHSMERITLFIK